MNPFVVSVLALADKPLKDEDITAGWTAFAVFILLAVAVAILGWSLTRQLRKVERAKQAGVYGEEPAPPPTPDS
jgi:hypothetical protein